MQSLECSSTDAIKSTEKRSGTFYGNITVILSVVTFVLLVISIVFITLYATKKNSQNCSGGFVALKGKLTFYACDYNRVAKYLRKFSYNISFRRSGSVYHHYLNEPQINITSFKSVAEYGHITSYNNVCKTECK